MSEPDAAAAELNAAKRSDPAGVIAFWQHAGPEKWFAKNPEFDREFHDRFLPVHDDAANGRLARWADTATGALALVLLLDQFPRNAFRGTPRMYVTDASARAIAAAAIAAGHDQAFDHDLRLFFYLPFAHSENLMDQDRSVALTAPLGEPSIAHAEEHREIVRRFSRFPHRNAILGRRSSAEEQAFLDGGGFGG